MGNLHYNFEGRTVIVTGAARGIGMEVARLFHESGGEVFLVDFDADELGKAAAEIGARGMLADVSLTDDVEAVVARAVEETGPVDVVVNNAGILRDAVLWKLNAEKREQFLTIHP